MLGKAHTCTCTYSYMYVLYKHFACTCMYYADVLNNLHVWACHWHCGLRDQRLSKFSCLLWHYSHKQVIKCISRYMHNTCSFQSHIKTAKLSWSTQNQPNLKSNACFVCEEELRCIHTLWQPTSGFQQGTKTKKTHRLNRNALLLTRRTFYAKEKQEETSTTHRTASILISV